MVAYFVVEYGVSLDVGEGPELRFFTVGSNGEGGFVLRYTPDGNLEWIRLHTVTPPGGEPVLVGNPVMGIDGDTGRLNLQALAGPGNAYACIDYQGELFRSDEPCRAVEQQPVEVEEDVVEEGVSEEVAGDEEVVEEGVEDQEIVE